ncbi:hypothetical protein N7474_006948 [Penicillium riverlandense]|uniref:uncharacterized protein n=1 Tax=Penicillium riverlandense TaxID=1903569 RepID=UPI002549AA71|nr:uncharacterized protein N7474_006948 [Penicillium riverlandense]KAJ5815171.1 hypothetical protein N7474_006948 [Penicillium riverlandense]
MATGIYNDKQPFRTDSGFPAEGTTPRLSLRDFVTEELSRGPAGLEREILITSKQLCDFLSSAEARQQLQTQHHGSINRIRPGTLKRRRPQTPPEQPSSEDEGSGEGRRESKSRRQSSDYRPGSSSGDSKSELH